MNREQFIQEVLASDICPKNFEKIYADFGRYQQLAMDTLNAFHSVCEKHGIRYQLAFGSLLGAIRDEGQIPWDYDVDVLVPYEDLPKLIEALDCSLDDRYYYYCPESNGKCRHFMMRLAPKGYDTQRLHVDVFYLVGEPRDEKERLDFENQVYDKFEMHYEKLVKLKDLSIKGKIKNVAKKILLIGNSVNKIRKEFDTLCKSNSIDKSERCVPIQGGYKHLSFLTEPFLETMLLRTRYGEFRVTKNYGQVLNEIYHDYSKIYPLEGRLNEMISHYNFLKGKKVIEPIKNAPTGRYFDK